MAENRFLTIEEVMQRYKISRSTLYRVIRDKLFPAGIHVGALRRWSLASLDEWDEAQAKAAAGK